MILEKERKLVVEYGKKLLDTGLVTGTFGNISVYNEEEKLMAISPSGLDYYSTKPEDVVVLNLEGEKVDGERKPSSEHDMHRIFYMKRPGIKAVIHTHSTYATILACLNWNIPPLHYLVAYAGKEVPCSKYEQFGTWELAESALETMGSGNACLLGNHGFLAAASTISYAFDVAEQIEFVSKLYYGTKTAGEPVLLNQEQIDVVQDAFKSYRTV